MRCEVCQGQRFIQQSPDEQPTPCAECQGFSVVSCCEVYAPEPEFWQIDRKADGLGRMYASPNQTQDR